MKSDYDKQRYAAIKADPVKYAAYLERKRRESRNRPGFEARRKKKWRERNPVKNSVLRDAHHAVEDAVREGMIYSLREGYEPSDYCDECAQVLAVTFREALEDIAEPMRKIQADAKAQGARIDGMAANSLCQDANWLRDKARSALREVKNG